MRATRWHVEIKRRGVLICEVSMLSTSTIYLFAIFARTKENTCDFGGGAQYIRARLARATCPPGGGAVTVATHTGAISCLYAPKCSEHSLRIVAAAPPTVEEAVPATGRLFSAGPRRLHPSPSLLYRVTSLVRNALVAEAAAARPV